MSSLPSPLTSATATEYRFLPTPNGIGAGSVPSPLPSSTLTVLALRLPTTRSSLPSPLRSATATEAGPLPAGKVRRGLEGAVAVAQQHAHVVAAVVGGDDVGDAVAVEVRHLHFVRSLRRPDTICGGPKVPSPWFRSTLTSLSR